MFKNNFNKTELCFIFNIFTTSVNKFHNMSFQVYFLLSEKMF